MPDKVMVVEDEVKLARTLRLYLEQENYHVVTVYDGAQALTVFRQERPDLVLLDLMLPHVDGWQICQQIRQLAPTPIIMVTARTEEADRIVGLELGADDYVTKPFSPREVVARVRAVLRRAQGHVHAVQMVRAGDVELDLERFSVTAGGKSIDLTRNEFQVLLALVRSPGRVFTRLQLLDQLNETAYVGYERVIDQHIKNLRAKLGDDARNPRYIATLYGIGYRFLPGAADHA
jgi:DNA-binding response OmpR family regulator